MRPSSKLAVLDAALRIARRDGLGAVTFEAVAEESGLSRGGIMYHFDSKEALLHAMHTHSAQKWEEYMLSLLGLPFSEATDADRLGAYLRASIDPATPLDLALVMDASTRAGDDSPSLHVANRWTPDLRDAERNEALLDQLVARLAADGLWTFAALTGRPLPNTLRDALIERISTLINHPASTENE